MEQFFTHGALQHDSRIGGVFQQLLIRGGVFLFSLTAVNLNQAADYYVAWDTGNDANNGTTMGSAWQSLEKVGLEIGNIPDGSTIHFKRGGIYRGHVGFNGRNNLTFIADWGAGDEPVLSGAKPIPDGNWQPSSACTGCYEAPFTEAVKNLYVVVGGTSQLQTLARYPNADAIDHGLMRTDAYSTYLIDDNDLPARPSGYWDGASVVLRVANWAHEVAGINGYDDGLKELYLGSPVSLPINSPTDGWGYFLVNKLEELDQEGEWFHDGSTLFFRAPGSGAPQNVEASVHEDGFLMQNSTNITTVRLNLEQNQLVQKVRAFRSQANLLEGLVDGHFLEGHDRADL